MAKEVLAGRWEDLAIAYEDMRRGLYDWGDRTPPRDSEGRWKVVNAELLRHMGLSPEYRDSGNRIFRNPKFLDALKREQLRRDHGLVELAGEIETSGAPVTGIANRIVEEINRRLEEDPEELSTKELLQYGPSWVRLGLELDGKIKSDHSKKIEVILAKVENKVAPELMAAYLERLQGYHMQRRDQIGTITIDGEATEEP